MRAAGKRSLAGTVEREQAGRSPEPMSSFGRIVLVQKASKAAEAVLAAVAAERIEAAMAVAALERQAEAESKEPVRKPADQRTVLFASADCRSSLRPKIREPCTRPLGHRSTALADWARQSAWRRAAGSTMASMAGLAARSLAACKEAD